MMSNYVRMTAAGVAGLVVLAGTDVCLGVDRGEQGAPVLVMARPAAEVMRLSASPAGVVTRGVMPLTYSLVARSDQDSMTTTMVFVRDGQRVEARRAGGRDAAWSVKLNGKDVPADRWSLAGGRLTVKGETGALVLDEPVSAAELSAQPELARPGGEVLANPRARLGVVMTTASDELVAHLGLAEGEYALVSEVQEGTAAAKAGLQIKDVLISIDGLTPCSIQTLRGHLKTKAPGDVVKLEVVRRGERKTIEVMLGAGEPGELGGIGFGGGIDGNDRWTALTDRLAQLGAKAGELGAKAGELGAKAGEDAARVGAEKAQAWRKRADEMAARIQREIEGQRALRFAVPRGPDGQQGEMLLLTDPPASTRELEGRIKELEGQIAELRRLVERLLPGAAAGAGAGPGGAAPALAVQPSASVPPSAPTPPTPSVPPSGSVDPAPRPCTDAPRAARPAGDVRWPETTDRAGWWLNVFEL